MHPVRHSRRTTFSGRGSRKREMRQWGGEEARVAAAGPPGPRPPGPPAPFPGRAPGPSGSRPGAGGLGSPTPRVTRARPRLSPRAPGPAGQVGAARRESPDSRWGPGAPSRVLPGAASPRPLPFCRAARARGPFSTASEPRALLSSAPPPSRCCAAAWPASAAGGSCPCCCSAPSPSTSSRWPVAAGCSRATTSRRPRCGGDASMRAAAAGPMRMAVRASWTMVSAATSGKPSGVRLGVRGLRKPP